MWIEYGNRLFSTVVGIACIAAGVLAFRVRPRRRDLLRPASVLAGGVIAQGVLGGITVALDLTWQVVIAHYLLSMALLVAGAVLVWRVRGGAARGRRPLGARSLTRALVVYGGAGDRRRHVRDRGRPARGRRRAPATSSSGSTRSARAR